jgi:hypothetical protein
MQNDFIAAPEGKMEFPASKAFNRTEIIGFEGLQDHKFLSLLWALFGKPHQIGFEGFTYQLMHVESGIVFQAYSGASGPAYCFSEIDKVRAREIVEKFESLLKEIKPVDCEIVIDTDFGKYKIGYKNGAAGQEKIN